MVRVIRIIIADSEVPRMAAGIRNCIKFPRGSSLNEMSTTGGDHPK